MSTKAFLHNLQVGELIIITPGGCHQHVTARRVSSGAEWGMFRTPGATFTIRTADKVSAVVTAWRQSLGLIGLDLKVEEVRGDRIPARRIADYVTAMGGDSTADTRGVLNAGLSKINSVSYRVVELYAGSHTAMLRHRLSTAS